MTSALIKMIPEPGTTLAQRATMPLNRTFAPSSRTIYRKHWSVVVYGFLPEDCMRVFTTSNGCVAKLATNPDPTPPRKDSAGLSFASALPLSHRVYSDMKRNRTLTDPPCLNAVERPPWYSPATPSLSTMRRTPLRKPMFRLMSFVLMVSCGVTTRTASAMPANKPATKLAPAESVPSAERSWSRKYAFAPKRQLDFGMERMSVGVRPV